MVENLYLLEIICLTSYTSLSIPGSSNGFAAKGVVLWWIAVGGAILRREIWWNDVDEEQEEDSGDKLGNQLKLGSKKVKKWHGQTLLN